MRRKGLVSRKPLLAAPLDATVFPEFADYLKDRRRASATKQRSQARTADDDAANMVIADQEFSISEGLHDSNASSAWREISKKQ